MKWVSSSIFAFIFVTIFITPVTSISINYIEVNGTLFTQPQAINITGWSSNLSSTTYLWNNYTGNIQLMSTITGAQTNITLSSNLDVGTYNVSCNSTWNSTLSWKTFSVVSVATTTTTVETTTTTTVPTTTIPTMIPTTSTLPPKPEDKELPIWSNLRHRPSVVTESDSVDIKVDWYDNVGLETVIIFENSTGLWEEYVCDKVTGRCPSRIIRLSVFADITSSFLIIGFVTSFIVTPTLMKVGHIPKIILLFLGIVIFIFLLSIFLFPELSRNISRAFSRLGIIPLRHFKTFTHTIPASNLDRGETVAYYSYANDTAGNEDTTEIKSFTVRAVEVTTTIPFVPEEIETVSVKEEQGEAEIGKPVKWRKEIVVTNPSIEEVKDYEVTGIPKDAKNIVVKDERGRVLYRDKSSWKTDIAGKGEISYFVEYETPAPYKEESEIKPFVPGERYIKRIAVKSDFVGSYEGIDIEEGPTGHYRDVKVFTDIPEKLSEEEYIIRLYLVGGNSKLDITDYLDYDVSFIDSDGNDIIDRVEWIVPHLFTQTEFEVEADLTIINVQSYPTVGGNWTVRFTTNGTADLIITPIEGTTFGEIPPDDLKFLELKCGDTVLDAEYNRTSVIYRNYHCDYTGYEISKVLTRGIHTLEFRFGNDVEYAHNQAEYFRMELQKITNVGSSWTLITFTNTYESPIVIATLEIGSGHNPDDTALSVRIRGVTSTGVDIKAMTPDYRYGSGTVPSNNIVYLMVIEEGYWDSITGFPKIEAGKFTTSTVVANKYGSVGDIINLNTGWSGDAEFFSNVVTDNDPGWIETWQSSSRGRLNPPTVTDFACSMSSAEVTPQDNHGAETIHWVVIQRGTGTFQGHNWKAGRTPDTIEEYTHNNLVNHNFGTTPIWGIADQLAMDGNNGGWSNWEDDPFTATQVEPYVQEDKYGDSETGHVSEEVSYFISDSIFSYSEDVSFNISLPGKEPVKSSGIKGEVATIAIEFNATSKTETVEPCVWDTFCSLRQTSSIPIFNFTNTGNIAEQWNISYTETLPSGVTLYGNTIYDRASATPITPSGWIANSNIPVGEYQEVWLWAEFVDAPPTPEPIAVYINHTSSKAS